MTAIRRDSTTVDIRDHRDGALPQRVNGNLPIKLGIQLQVTTQRHGIATRRPAVAALLTTSAAEARQLSRVSPRPPLGGHQDSDAAI